MRMYDLYEYVNAGCMQVESGKFAIGHALHNATGGKMCIGCHVYNDGKCVSYKKMSGKYDKVKIQQPLYTETVRDEAKRRNVSIKQIRRERRDNQNE